MGNMVPNLAVSHFIKPTVDTPFHIDFSWWEKQGLDLNVKLMGHLCYEHRQAYAGRTIDDKMDWVDWETGEVQQVDGLQYIITTHCSRESDYIKQASTLMESVFRAFLSNANQPLSPRQLEPLVGHHADQVLRLLSGKQVRLGLRPVMNA